jgi:hypothetical protein
LKSLRAFFEKVQVHSAKVELSNDLFASVYFAALGFL